MILRLATRIALPLALCVSLFSSACGGEKTPDIALVPYKLVDIEDSSSNKRKRIQVSVALADPAAQVASQNLVATCMAAAKFYAETKKADTVSVFIDDMPGSQSWEGTRLAQCSYSPDTGGWSGDQGWTWQDVKAAPRGLTEPERQMKKLWGDLRGQFQKPDGTDETALRTEIAKSIGVQPDEVMLMTFILRKIDSKPYEGIKAQGPTK